MKRFIMKSEYSFKCTTCGNIEDRNVLWVKLPQNIDMSFCPNCKTQIRRVKTTGTNKDTFDKYRGVVSGSR